MNTLLHDTSWTNDWYSWLVAAEVADVVTDEGLAFSLYSLAVQAAIDGAGILMAHEALVAAPLASGALTAPFSTRIKTGLSLSILVPERTPPHVMQVVDWLVGPGLAM